MFDESIDASPNSCQRSLRKKRGRRKTSRACLYESSLSISNTSVFLNNETDIATSQLAAMCWDSDQDEDFKQLRGSIQSKPLNNCERFKKENMLAAANRNTLQQTRTVYKPTQMFQTCEKLLGTQHEHCPTQFLTCDNQSQKCLNIQTIGMNTKLFDTEELLTATTNKDNLNETLRPKSSLDSLNDFELNTTFVENAVHLAQKPTTLVAAKTKNAQSIVDSILQDFCASLESSEEVEREIGDFEPFFRFRRKKIRTYERSKRKPQLLHTQVPAPLNSEDMEISDTSSELSIQEGNSQIIPAAEPLALNTTGPLHNNLLNLSAFFTQNLLDSEVHDSVVQAREDMLASKNSFNEIKLIYEDISKQIQKILTLHKKYENFSYPILHGSPNDLLGFSSPVASAARVTGKVDNIVQSMQVFKSASINIENEETPVFNEGSWQHDSDFFANFKTQVVLKTPKESALDTLTKNKQNNQNCLEFSTSKAITLQNTVNPVENDLLESQINVDDVLQQFEQPNIQTAARVSGENGNAWKCDFENMILSEWQLDDIKFDNESVNEKVKSNGTTPVGETKIHRSSTSLNKACDTVKETLEGVDILVDLFDDNDFWNETFTQVKKIQEQALTNEQVVLGFKDNKMTKIDENKNENKNCNDEKNNKLNNGTELILSQPTTSHQALLKRKMKEENENMKTQKTTTIIEAFIGFRTGNSKIIHFTKEALKKGEQILENLPELPEKVKNNNTKTEIKNCIKPQTTNFNDFEKSIKSPIKKCETNMLEPFIGFRTGNAKIINVSEEALKKGAHILENLPALSNTIGNNNTKADSMNCENKQCSKKNITTQTSNANVMENSSKTPINKTFIGFQTGNSKIIHFTEEALKKGERILDQLPELSKKTGKKQKTTLMSPQKVLPLVNQISDSALQAPTTKVKPTSTSFVGFETASCKSINVSEEALKKYENYFANIPEEPLTDTELPHKTVKKQHQPLNEVCSPKKAFINTNSQSKKQNIQCEKDEFTNMQLSEWLPSGFTPPNKLEQSKRKFENVESSASVFEQPAKLLCKSETMHENSHNLTNSVAIKSCSSHLPTKTTIRVETPNIIVRKNLLSLSKTRKMRLKQTNQNNCNNGNDSTNNVETPVKLMAATKLSEISNLRTPNASEFFERLPNAASTPNQKEFSTTDVRTPVTNCALRKTENLDSDFQHINWEQIDDSKVASTAATSLCKTPSCQKSALKHLPSPQERIENLSSCGDPPPVPKIVSSNSSRRFLGLSRKSILKK